jgi:hypothetical protein
MYQRAVEAQAALQGARRKVLAALNDASRDPRTAEVCRHLTGLNFALQAAEFTAAEAVNAAQCYDAQESHGATIRTDVTRTVIRG